MTMENSFVSGPLPLEKMPECWVQDDRMNALFAPFRSANPQDWKSKHEFWRNMIDEWSKHNLRCSFSLSELNEAFKRKGCSPLCLPTVLEECRRDKLIISEVDFYKYANNSWAAWTVDILIKKPVAWSFSVLKSYVTGQNINVDEKFIYVPTVKYLGELILSTITEKGKENVLLPVFEIVQDCQPEYPRITEIAVKYSLLWLKHTYKATFTHDTLDSKSLVKLNSHHVKKITEVDEGLYNLQRQEEKLLHEIELMERNKINILNEAKSYISDNKKLLAKTYLRRKAKLEKDIEKRMQVLDNVQTLICRIQDSHSNTDVLAAYKAGSEVLKKFRQDGLSEDSVRDVMDTLSEAIEDHQEVETALSESIRSAESDSDLERELEELMKADDVAHDTEEPQESLENLEKRLSNLLIQNLPSPPRETSIKSTEENSLRRKQDLPTQPSFAT